MTIINNTKNSIFIASECLIKNTFIKPGESFNLSERNKYTVNVHSNLGSSVIRTEYSRRHIRNFGKLVAKFGDYKDKNGRKIITVIYEE